MSTQNALTTVSDQEAEETLSNLLTDDLDAHPADPDLEAPRFSATPVAQAAADAVEVRSASAMAASDGLRRATEAAIAILERKRDAQLDRLRTDRELRHKDRGEQLHAVNGAKAEALRIAALNADQAATLQEEDKNDQKQTEELIVTETLAYNSMINSQRNVLLSLQQLLPTGE